MKQDYWFDRFQSIYVISEQQGCRCWVAFTAVPHVAMAAWLRSPYLCDWDWCVRAVHASYSAECFIRAVLGMAWHQCLGPALSSCGVLGTKCCILEEKKVNGFGWGLRVGWLSTVVHLTLAQENINSGVFSLPVGYECCRNKVLLTQILYVLRLPLQMAGFVV